MSTCTICYDNKISSFVCSYCKFQACQECNQKFIEERPREPLCMNCGKIWSREFVLEESNDKQWFFLHIGKYILEQEKMLLSSTQEEASIAFQIQKLSCCIQKLPTNAQLTRMFKHKGLEQLSKAIFEKQNLRNNCIKIIRELKNKSILYNKSNNHEEKNKQTRWILKCPRDCRGFISDKYKCGTCIGSICVACNAPIEPNEEHECEDDNIKSAALILSMTKPCPKCMTLINKSDGCDQMFCVICKTAFAWSTGKIETGVIHNPHYYEYLGTLGVTVVDIDLIACGEIPDALMFMTRIISVTSNDSFIKHMQKLHRNINHIRRVLMPAWSNDRVKNNIDIRIQYLIGNINMTEWAMKLSRREKKRMKGKAFYDLLNMITVVMEDFTRQIFSFDIISEYKWQNDVSNILNQLSTLKEYYWNTLDKICFIHGGKKPPSLVNAFA